MQMKNKEKARQLAINGLQKILARYDFEVKDAKVSEIFPLPKEHFYISLWIPTESGGFPTRFVCIFHYPEDCFYLDRTLGTFEELLHCYRPDLRSLKYKELELLLMYGSPYVAIVIDYKYGTPPIMVIDSILCELAVNLESDIYDRWEENRETGEELEENFSLTAEVIQFLRSVPEGEIVLKYPDMLKTSYLPDGSLEFFLNTTTEDSPDRARVIKVIITPDYKLKTADIGPGYTLPGIA